MRLSAIYALISLALLIAVSTGCERGPYPSPAEVHSAQSIPVWTPDGESIVFYYVDLHLPFIRGGKPPRLFVVGHGGSDLYTLSDLLPEDEPYDYDFFPSISPDGSRLAFATYRGTGYRVSPEIATSGLDGSDYRRLTDNGWVKDTSPAWSPDGTRIAFVSYRMPAGWDEDLKYDDGPDIYTMAPDGSDVRMVNPPSISVTPDPPAWSPNGRSIAFLAEEEVVDEEERERLGHSITVLYITSADSSDVKRISRATTPPAWSPDGSLIAFGISDGGYYGQYARRHTVSHDGSGLRELPDFYDLIGQTLSWMPGGSEITFAGIRNSLSEDGSYTAISGYGIHAVKEDGSGFRTIAELPLGSNDVVVWSPDGSRIALMKPDAKSIDASGILLYTLAADGSDRRDLVRAGLGAIVAEHSDWPDVVDDIAGCSKGFVVSDPDENPGLVKDCQTLLSIRNVLAGNGVVLGWSADIPIANWFGIEVRGNPRRVRTLIMNASIMNEKVRGLVPAELWNLTELEVLDIRNSFYLTGPIPPELGKLENLKWLILRGNNLTGEIPPELGELESLEYLDLAGNELTGSIPSTLAGLENLAELVVGGNDLTGCIPAELIANPSLDIGHIELEPCQ